MATIVTKNSSIASAVPTTSDLVQGELAVNVTDKRIFTENASTQIVELGTNPSTITTGSATVTGTLTANGTFASNNAVITGGSINSTPIGATTPSTVRGSTVTATTGFVGGLTGNVTGNLTGNVTGNVVGNLTGNVTGNVTASSGTTTLNNLVVNGTADFTNTKLTNITTPTLDSDAANKGYVDATVAAVIDSAPAALDTLNELAAALGDDANFSATVTTALATKLPLAGGTMTGAIAMGTSKITGLGDPTASQDAATKIYVDTADNLKLNLSGGTMSGAIAMGTNKITGLGDPTLAQDAATKAYTDSILGSATSAAASAAAAATSESNAATSASNAATSETNALNSANAAASSYDQFDDRYLGDKASDPTLDNDGNALLTGALYFNTTTDVMRVYTGSAWQDVAISTNSPTFTGTVTANDIYVGDTTPTITIEDTDGATTGFISATGSSVRFGASTSDAVQFYANNTVRQNIASNGDISFYEDTGTTPKFFWDASAESLGIGTTSPSSVGGFNKFIQISGTSASIALTDTDASLINTYEIGSAGNSFVINADGTERLRIDSSGNVGIGTSSPTEKLSVRGIGSQYILIQSDDNSGSGIYFGNTGSTDRRITLSSSNLLFENSNGSAEYMRLDSSGNLLVGTSSAGIGDAGIELRADGQITGTRDGNIAALFNRLTSNGEIVQFRKDGTTVGSIGSEGGDSLYIVNGDTGLRFVGGVDSIVPSNANGAVRDAAIDIGYSSQRFKDLYLSGGVNFEGATGNTLFKSGSDLILTNRTAGVLIVGTNNTERMRIDSSGNLLVGTTSLNHGSEKIAVLATGSIGISVNRDANYYPVWFERSDVNVGNIFCTSVSTAYNTSSDQRLKENIADADDAGSKVDAIQVRQFDWKADGSHQDYGMVAQELAAVAPEAVTQPEDPEAMMSVDYSKLVPMLIKEIQSLRNRVATLEGN